MNIAFLSLKVFEKQKKRLFFFEKLFSIFVCSAIRRKYVLIMQYVWHSVYQSSMSSLIIAQAIIKYTAI